MNEEEEMRIVTKHRLTYRGVELPVGFDPRNGETASEGITSEEVDAALGNWLNGVDAALTRPEDLDESPKPDVGWTPILAGFPRPEPEQYRYYRTSGMIYRYKDGREDPEAILANRESDYWEECGGPREGALSDNYPQISYSELPAHAKDQVTNEGEFLVWFDDGLWVGHTKHADQDVSLGSEATHTDITAAIEKIKERI